MSAKHVFTSLSILCVALLVASSRPVSAQTATAWLYGYQASPGPSLPAVMGVAVQVGTPTAMVLGHLPAAGVAGEVAVAQAILSIGDQVPLPTYADGALASEDAIFWTSQIWRVEFSADGIVRYQSGDHLVATFNGRQLVSVGGQINTGAPVPPTPINAQVFVSVVAVRFATTPTTRQTMGSIKARYR
jgi:hypothetical protein